MVSALTLLLSACTPLVGKADSASGERQLLIDELDASLRDRALWRLPSPPVDGDWSEFPQSTVNPLTDAKVELGRALFSEPGLASDPLQLAYRDLSCANCHNPDYGFGSGQVTGRGIGFGGEGRAGERRLQAGMDIALVDFSIFNDMRVVNLAWTAAVAGWVGGFDPVNGIYPPIMEPEEGADGLEIFVESALVIHGFFPMTTALVPPDSVLLEGSYDALVAAAFPELGADSPMTRRQVAYALSAYVRSIVTDQAPFQEFLRMDSTADPDEVPLSDEALRGAVLFFGSGRCTSCHTGPSLASELTHNVGLPLFDEQTQIPGYLPEDPEGADGWGTVAQYYNHDGQNIGRFRVTLDMADYGAYRVPTVYGAGAEGVVAYGHGASVRELDDMVRHLSGGNDPGINTTLDPNRVDYLDPVLFSSDVPFLSEAEVQDIVSFIEEGLSDPALADAHRPNVLSTGGYCSITNDELSQSMTPGCELARDP